MVVSGQWQAIPLGSYQGPAKSSTDNTPLWHPISPTVHLILGE
jgi:hypothetical protein